MTPLTPPDMAEQRAAALMMLRGCLGGQNLAQLAYVNTILDPASAEKTVAEIMGPILGGWCAVAVELLLLLAAERNTTPIALLDSLDAT
jgi:hypothetical protein